MRQRFRTHRLGRLYQLVSISWYSEFERKGRPQRPAPPADRPSWWRDVGAIDVRGNIPMGAASTPTDIGHCVAWMCSDYARLITGCDFVIDGGARAKYWGYTPPSENAGPVPLVPLDGVEVTPPMAGGVY